ncbi:MAG TPA: cbb3-type cytochrome c oxidase N-terminal domain-containing protein [Cyclobacteriaceae bacterium]|nr:cbb3-type cytochrome c oxidase N-terminal domain-containing protein [Cyclobacteriaceae bacterium]
MKKVLITFLFIFYGTISHAQTAVQAPANQDYAMNTDTLLLIAIWTVIAVSILVLIVAIYALKVVRSVLLREKPGFMPDSGEAVGTAGDNIWKKISKSLSKATPVEEEYKVMLEHNYDGIRELDNHLPPWWMWLFYISIGWAAVYLLLFHVFNLFPLSGEEYINQLTRAQEEMEARKVLTAESIDETNVEFSAEPAIIDNGKSIFIKLCVACHAPDGGGGVGPNLTDEYWIHGGNIRDMFKVIKYGVPEKGMISWQTQLRPAEIRDVSCFIETLKGTVPAKPKEPQGDLYTPEPSSAEDTAQQVMIHKEIDLQNKF